MHTLLKIGSRTGLRLPVEEDRVPFMNLRQISADFLRTWEPLPPPGVDPFALEFFDRVLSTASTARRRGLLVIRLADGVILGAVNLNEIVRGAFQSCYLGYWIGQPHARQGYMTEAVALAVRYAFEDLGLHRVEANISPENIPSRALVERLGFAREGLSPRYLRIAGIWRDHERWALTAEDGLARPWSAERRAVLVTGSSGWLGAALVRRLGAAAVGLDPVPAPTTQVVGSVADADLVRRTIRRRGITAVVHAGALHKPHVATHSAEAFIDVNVRGTLVALQAASDLGVERFVFTSTTSLLIDRDIRYGTPDRAHWLTEARAPLRPRNIYGVSKLAAEQLCRLHHELSGLPVTILRTSRFFPEDDDKAHRIAQSGPNTKANELLFRRLTLDDCVDAHLHALERAPALGFDTFIVSAPTPFQTGDAAALATDAPAVVARYHPRYLEVYARLGWTMFPQITRVYDATRSERVLGFRCRTDFGVVLDRLAAGEDPALVVGHQP